MISRVMNTKLPLQNIKSKKLKKSGTECLASLRRELKTEITNDAFFELKYDRTLLSDTIKRFYFKGTIEENDELHQRQFLTQSNLTSNFAKYCAPTIVCSYQSSH